MHIPFAKMLLGESPTLRGYRWFDSSEISGIDTKIIPPVFLLKNDKSMLGSPLEEQYNANLRDEMIDALNNVYVAFTRAVDELCITCPIGSRDSNMALSKKLDEVFKIADQTFCDGIQAESNVDSQLYVPLNGFNGEILEIGKPTIARREEDKEEMSVDKVNELNPSPYFTQYRKDIWSKVRLEDAEMMNDMQERGIFLHKVMENVRHRDDLLLSLKRQGYRNVIPQEELDEMYKALSSALADARVGQWFEGYTRVITERPIGIDALTETTRPDRVVWTTKGTVDVVDYKFGEEDDKKYKEQVKGYMDKLTKSGYENVRGFVWYVFKDRIVEVK